jgi:glycosyltransferase involved in cell wall biosynthesis
VPDVYPYLEQADVFALPSLEEGSGSVSLLEAMQAGAAPVITQVDGLPEDVIDGQSALLVEPNNVASLAAALRRLLTDSSLRKRVAAEAHKQYLKRFSAEAFTQDVRRIYTALGFPSRGSADAADDRS